MQAARGLRLRVLVDLDGVLADFEEGFYRAWRQLYPDRPALEPAARRSVRILDDYSSSLAADVRAVYHAPGFLEGLPPVEGAVNGFAGLLSVFPDTWICSSPLVRYGNCVLEKYRWVERVLGFDATGRLILTRDKSLVGADVLIDDDPSPRGLDTASWQHVVFDASYNRVVTDRPRMTWATWREILGAPSGGD